MKVFIAGAGGAIGMRLTAQLVAGGHEVAAMTRSGRKQSLIEELGAQAVVADALDRRTVMQVVVRAKPQVVVSQLTSLTGVSNLKHFDREFALTNRLRTEGTDHLLEAARAAGARRFVAQSYGNWTYERRGSPVKTEDDPFDPDPPAEQIESLRAIRQLERAVLDADGIEAIALRYGNFYGPGTGLAADGEVTAIVAKRRFPIIGDGAGIWSFLHVDDAAAATVAAVERGAPGVYNVADDEPASVAEWLPALAAALGAKPPRRVPVWVGRLAAGEVGVSMMTRIRGIANEKAKRELDWSPAHPSWRQGFRTILAGERTLSAPRRGKEVESRS
ncbi:MAG TPA: NAD(P)-dependent oxidoreductase [Solirubrobacteraceae bacterium]